jgi:hypothetical protein
MLCGSHFRPFPPSLRWNNGHKPNVLPSTGETLNSADECAERARIHNSMLTVFYLQVLALQEAFSRKIDVGLPSAGSSNAGNASAAAAAMGIDMGPAAAAAAAAAGFTSGLPPNLQHSFGPPLGLMHQQPPPSVPNPLLQQQAGAAGAGMGVALMNQEQQQQLLHSGGMGAEGLMGQQMQVGHSFDFLTLLGFRGVWVFLGGV